MAVPLMMLGADHSGPVSTTQKKWTTFLEDLENKVEAKSVSQQQLSALNQLMTILQDTGLTTVWFVMFFNGGSLDDVLRTFPEKDMIVNGTGVWHIGGPHSDTGVTGRKIVVDGYGGYARVGGGAFSGKDPTKVDRSGAYAARYLAKNIVAAGLADRAEVRLAYFIGAQQPLMQDVETFGTEKVSDIKIKNFMESILDTSVERILDGLQLQRPIYTDTAAYGHFGRDIFPWEKIKK